MVQSEISLPIIVAVLLGAGFLTLGTAAGPSELHKQALFLVIAVFVCVAVLLLGRQRVVRLAPTAYLFTTLLLVLTQLIGTEVNGAKSWLYLGPLPGFQPSELAKLALILMLGLGLHQRPIRGPLSYLRPGVLIAIPCVLVFLEPDLGGALVIAAIGAGMLLVRGIPWRHLLILLLIFAVAMPTVVWPHLTAAQKDRVVSFIRPAADPQGSGYQVIQARIAIGSGGLFGKGYKQGTQAQLGFIPYQETDFIFPVLAEEGGFVAAVSLLTLYGLLFWRLAVMALECPAERDQLIIVGVLSFIAFQVLVNVGVTLGLAPVTGITLPLVSYGGTSLLSTLTALCLAYVVHRDRFANWL